MTPPPTLALQTLPPQIHVDQVHELCSIKSILMFSFKLAFFTRNVIYLSYLRKKQTMRVRSRTPLSPEVVQAAKAYFLLPR